MQKFRIIFISIELLFWQSKSCSKAIQTEFQLHTRITNFYGMSRYKRSPINWGTQNNSSDQKHDPQHEIISKDPAPNEVV